LLLLEKSMMIFSCLIDTMKDQCSLTLYTLFLLIENSPSGYFSTDFNMNVSKMNSLNCI